jgi:hypothetical protein
MLLTVLHSKHTMSAITSGATVVNSSFPARQSYINTKKSATYLSRVHIAKSHALVKVDSLVTSSSASPVASAASTLHTKATCKL